MPTSFEDYIVPAMKYSDNSDFISCVYYFVKELLLTVFFVVGLSVLPVLLSLNRLSIWWTPLLLYPLYFVSVDPSGMGSTLNPAYMYTQLQLLDGSQSSFWQHVLAQLLGGIYAGKIHLEYFPDDRNRR